MSAPVPITLAVVNPKGGAGKTTAAAHAAYAQHERGFRVLAVDADEQGSLFTWHQTAAFPFPCVQVPSARLHRDVAGMVDLYDVIVIDTPGRKVGRAIALSALIAASHVLVPIAPTGIEFAELRHVRAMLDEATDLRPSGTAPEVGVMLVKVVAGAGSTAGFRAGATRDGWPVLHGEARRLERFAQAFPHPIVNASETGYGDAVAELLSRGT